MEGSPVRGQRESRHARLNDAQNLECFQAELVRLVAAELSNVEVFCGLTDGTASTLNLPSWVKSHLDRHPDLYKKLEQGEFVGITHKEENPSPRPAESVRSSVLLIPIINDSTIHGTIGLVSPMDGPQLSQEHVEMVRRWAYEASPVLARLYQIEELLRENRALSALAQRTTAAEKRLAEVIGQRDKFAAVLQMRSQLQSNIAHELRTPLAAIRGYARMILDGRTGEISKTQEEYLSVVTENTNRLIHIVTWMTHLAEFSADQMTLSQFDLLEVWSQCTKANASALDQKSMQLSEVIPDESFLIVGDPEKLADVFNQVIAASVASSGTKGKILAEFSHGREREVTVKISDNGAGIPAEILSRISDRSFGLVPMTAAQRADASEFKLSRVYEVIAAHGGRVFVSSKAGEGSTFIFTLPAVTLGGEERLGHEQAVNFGRRRR